MVHQYKLGGYNIVLDSCSGSVHVVDEAAYDMIAMYSSNSREEIVKKISTKHSHRPELTRGEIESCLDSIEELKR